MKDIVKKNKKWIIFIVIIGVISISYIYAKYIKSVDVSGDFSDNEFARYYLTLGGDSTEAISLPNLNPGSIVTIPIIVSNAESIDGEKKQSEVDLHYEIAVVTTNHLPLSFVVKDAAGNQLQNTDIKLTDKLYDNKGKKVIFGKNSSNEDLLFSKDKLEEVPYSIVIEWPASKDDFAYTKEIDQLYILVEAKQAMPR